MVLAPTIVLAKQHYEVISERFSRYPDIKVGLLSRFQSKSEKEECLHMIKNGHLGIIDGTHSLLGSGVVYNNLGLLVVDEEQLDLDINPHLPSDYINHLENPMEIINDAEKAARKDIWSLMQFTESLRRQYGKEPYSMEILLKKLYVKRMAADMGISRIYTSGKMVGMKTNMNKMIFKLIADSMASDIHRNSLVLEDGLIKAELLLELPREQLLNWIFQCLSELYASLPALIKC